MKKTILTLAFALSLLSCKTGSTAVNSAADQTVQVNINLTDVTDDKVLVTVTPPKITSDEINYSLPKIVPGTYSEDDYGRFIDDLKAFDVKGNVLVVNQTDKNTWNIKNAKKIARITYLVNDTFDT